MLGNKLTITLTEDIITFIKLLRVKRVSDNQVTYDLYELFSDSNPLDFMSKILGLEDEMIKGSEFNPLGAEYSESATERMYKIYGYICDNLQYILEIMQQFCDVGVKVGKYTTLSYNRIWKYIGEE